MKNRYFNETAFQYAIDLMETNPYQSKERFEDYLDKYPNDYYARIYYVILLTRIHLFNEARDEYNSIVNDVNIDNYFLSDANRLKGFKYNLLIARIKLLIVFGKYKELYTLIEKNKNIYDIGDIVAVRFFCKEKLGYLNYENTDHLTYRFKQIYDYSEEAFLEHIKKHQVIDGEENTSTSLFVPDLDIKKVLEEIKKYIPSNKALYTGFLDDTYYFKYDNCGRVHGKLTNFIKVATFYGSENFITMCPDYNQENLPYVDLNYLKDNENINVKRLSQIDKFNRRFNRK